MVVLGSDEEPEICPSVLEQAAVGMALGKSEPRLLRVGLDQGTVLSEPAPQRNRSLAHSRTAASCTVLANLETVSSDWTELAPRSASRWRRHSGSYLAITVSVHQTLPFGTVALPPPALPSGDHSLPNAKLVNLLNQGVSEWNKWRQANPTHRVDLMRLGWEEPILEERLLDGIDLANAWLQGADLSGCSLVGARLDGAILLAADLSDADLSECSLLDTNLARATLRKTILDRAVCNHATLLASAALSEPSLLDTRFEWVDWGNTLVAGSDLSEPAVLDGWMHRANEITVSTLLRTAEGLQVRPDRKPQIDRFLARSGVPKEIVNSYATWMPSVYYSVFISYSSHDSAFARRLYEELSGRGVRCWMDERSSHPGRDVYGEIDQAIQLHEKVLLVCSEHSLSKSWWVDDEIEKAFNKERALQKQLGTKANCLIPLDLDGYLFSPQAHGKATSIRARVACNFRGWATDANVFEREVQHLMNALKHEMPPVRASSSSPSTTEID